jgi:glycosyltransferase involved in cell wall biosynthesis
MIKTVLHINSGTSGGPGRVMNTIYDALEEKGFNNIIAIPRGISSKNILHLSKSSFYFSRVLTKIYSYTSTSHIIIEPEVFCISKSNKILKATKFKIDYIILYWYKNTISIKDVYKIVSKSGARLFIYMMDNAVMTGGCHYPVECKRYEIGCGSCPSILWGKLKKDITNTNVLTDQYYLEKCNATIICPTTLSLKEAEKSFKLAKLEKKLLMIPLGEDYTVKLSKTESRKLLSISHTGKVIFFGAQTLTNERKGMIFLFKALKIVFNELNSDERKNVHIIVAGNKSSKTIQETGFSFNMLGYLDHLKLINAYKAADFFISPSIVDMGPMMVSESIKSGTPVLSFNIGSSEDLVINGITGYRTDKKDYITLANNILKMIRLTEEESNRMSLNCYNMGEKLLSFNTFFSNLEQLFLKNNGID